MISHLASSSKMQPIHMPAGQLDCFLNALKCKYLVHNRCVNTTEYLNLPKDEWRGEQRNAQQHARQGTMTYRTLGQLLLLTGGRKRRVTQDMEKAHAWIDRMGGCCLALCIFPAEYIFTRLLGISSSGSSSLSAGGFAKPGACFFTLHVSEQAAAKRRHLLPPPDRAMAAGSGHRCCEKENVPCSAGFIVRRHFRRILQRVTV